MRLSDETRSDPAQMTSADPTEIALSDDDILEAMRAIPGYLDISPSDVRVLYHLAHRHALERLCGGLNAGRMMRTGIEPLTPEIPLREAIGRLTRQGLRTLPVIDPARQVVGVFTETDVLRALGAERLLDLLARLIAQPPSIDPRRLQTGVGVLMSAPPVCVSVAAGVHEILAAFARHPGRAMPVLAPDGQLTGLLLRKDMLNALHLEALA